MSDPAPPLHAWLDRFFDACFAQQPVSATFVGVHEHDHRLPDWSEAGLGDALAAARSLLSEAEALEGTAADRVGELDRRLAVAHLRLRIQELASLHFERGNPSLYVAEAVFGMMSLLLTDFAPLPERLDRLRARMLEVPRLLAQARNNVRRAPTLWTVRALRECRGASAFLTGGIDSLLADEPEGHREVWGAARRAASAFEEYARYLQRDLLREGNDGYACGREALERYVSEGHFLTSSIEELAARARDRLAECQAELESRRSELGGASHDDLQARLRSRHPAADEYLTRYRVEWEEMRRIAEEQALVSWPDAPLRFVPVPPWAREAAPDLYFLFYRSPAAFARPAVHDYLVPPLTEGAAPEARRALLERHNAAVIKLNHVIHHGGLGHHVQNGHATASRSRVGRVAGVDCASRIAMFCGGTMTEGWACYATDLMSEVGALTPLEAYAEARARVRLCVRALVDVEIHSGATTVEGAAASYRRIAGMTEAAATAEAVKTTMFPATALMYMVGRDAIHDLRARESRRLGSGFSLRAFHDQLLSYGSVPVALVAREMSDAAAAADHDVDREG